MANYNSSIKKILKHEGGYVNDPVDNGGETYKGIARKFWPKWIGWKFVDAQRNEKNFPKILYTISGLNDMVFAFYKTNFWDKIGGDAIESQEIADLLVDSAVNEGIVPAIKRAEAIVGLTVTGKISDDLIKKINAL
jgi:lysozyme family protein